MNTIKIDDNWRVQYDGSQYILERWDAGGREARNPKTGEMIETQAKWVNQGRYFTTLSGAVMHVIKCESSERSHDLKEFVEFQKEWLVKLDSMLGGVAQS